MAVTVLDSRQGSVWVWPAPHPSVPIQSPLQVDAVRLVTTVCVNFKGVSSFLVHLAPRLCNGNLIDVAVANVLRMVNLCALVRAAHKAHEPLGRFFVTVDHKSPCLGNAVLSVIMAHLRESVMLLWMKN